MAGPASIAALNVRRADFHNRKGYLDIADYNLHKTGIGHVLNPSKLVESVTVVDKGPSLSKTILGCSLVEPLSRFHYQPCKAQRPKMSKQKELSLSTAAPWGESESGRKPLITEQRAQYSHQVPIEQRMLSRPESAPALFAPGRTVAAMGKVEIPTPVGPKQPKVMGSDASDYLDWKHYHFSMLHLHELLNVSQRSPPPAQGHQQQQAASPKPLKEEPDAGDAEAAGEKEVPTEADSPRLPYRRLHRKSRRRESGVPNEEYRSLFRRRQQDTVDTGFAKTWLGGDLVKSIAGRRSAEGAGRTPAVTRGGPNTLPHTAAWDSDDTQPEHGTPCSASTSDYEPQHPPPAAPVSQKRVPVEQPKKGGFVVTKRTGAHEWRIRLDRCPTPSFGRKHRATVIKRLKNDRKELFCEPEPCLGLFRSPYLPDSDPRFAQPTAPPVANGVPLLNTHYRGL